MSASTTASSKVVEVNDTALSYRECGKGEPLVLLHGHISDQRTWIDLEHKLATRFHVFNYSRRFAWPNEPVKDGQGTPWEQDALDLAAFIETLNIGPVHVLANSSGAVISLYLARRKPHLFRNLMVEEPPLVGLFLPTLPPSLPSVLSFLLWHPVTFWPVMYFGATMTATMIQHCKKGEFDQAVSVFCSGVMGPKFWPRIQADADRLRQVEDNAKWLCNFFRYNTMPKYLAEDAQNTKVPMLVMAGKESAAHQRYTVHELFRVSGAEKKRIAYIDAAGHLMHEDNPEGVFNEVVRFIFDDAAA
ncbi:uncharacterized protein Z519_02110 [Cladophialophora bantiana CBS 173.52]|uniref:AB hydrolase-1 domain-containing protein n=1 Tax=Cladophialophora bantiana (strain ATCC 10958 / CBS 173.52 / CDC B-1940 / NIH 8579) TaxID=1442370 RepID=A0A0D2IIW1_CLAB1|nr:uncharacterized protein Z519_02110 [Cladophialophora bantiana CBS 173.52]KIW96719.1 hypothetical protein Z519_02110 [Cladophialophora bantiana CBS 173.52]